MIRWRPSLALAFIVGTASLVDWTSRASAQIVFRSATDLVALQVTVTDERRRYVPDLRLEDFRVLDEGVPQAISLFAAGTVPLDLMLLLDMSGSMGERLPTLQKAALEFVRGLGPDDRATIVVFHHRVRTVHALTADPSGLEPAILALSAGGGTALYDALYIGLKELARARHTDKPRRQALVVFTDGFDTASHLSFNDVFAGVRGSTLTVYTIVPPDDAPDGRRRRAPPFDMRLLADETGGRMFSPSRLEELSLAYREIAEELKQQYWLAYVPTSSTAGFRRVSVHIVTRPALRARTRSGYHASAAAP